MDVPATIADFHAPTPTPPPAPDPIKPLRLKVNGTMIGLALVVLALVGKAYWPSSPAVDPTPAPVPIVDPIAVSIVAPVTKMTTLHLPDSVAAGSRIWWLNPDPAKLQVLEYPDHAVLCPQVAGQLYFAAETFHAGAFKRLTWAIDAGKGPIPPPVDPVDPEPVIPTPPTPKPVDPVKPPVDPKTLPPIPVSGFRVLVVYESATKLPAAQAAIFNAKEIRDYLNLRCVEVAGKKEFRFWDKDISTANVSPFWQAAMSRPRTSVPWIVISNGVNGFEGPLPANVAATMALLKQFGGV